MGHWWKHQSLEASEAGLLMDGIPLATLARQYGTPLYVYSLATVQRQIRLLQATLAEVTNHAEIYYAMKANRHPAVLRTVQTMLGVGIDACSPREVQLAQAHGFKTDEISFNAGMLSNHDLAQIAESKVHCTLDSFSALRRYGACAPRGTHVGLRFDPGVVVSYGNDPKTAYSKTKFGFEAEEVVDALTVATQAGLVVDSVHMHIGWGLAERSAPLVDQAFARLAAIARQAPALRAVNVGGGLGGHYQASDQPLRLDTWRDLLYKHFAPLDVLIACEPGTFIVAPAGVLIVEVNTVEKRRGIHWIGVDAGFAIAPCPALYDIPLAAVAVERPLAPHTQSYYVAGHINESCDIWVKNQMLPTMQEGELLALLPAGAYGASMASDHCLRGDMTEIAV